ncbi:MAG: sulfotransferase [Sphingopyxis sp.]
MNAKSESHTSLGWLSLAEADYSGAEAHFRAALALAPRDPESLVGMAKVLRQRGLLRDAVLHCDAAIRSRSGYADAWLERGFVLASGGSMAAAKDCYLRVIALDPAQPDAHAGLASIFARDGDSAQARSHAEQAFAADPGNAIASAALATIEIEAGQPATARDLLEPLVAQIDTPSADRILLYGLLGDACSKLGAADAAYSAFAAAKADFAVLHAARYQGREPHHQFIRSITQDLERYEFVTSVRPEHPPLAATKHLFLLGYPRSGTTMVENILASLPDVVALEERPTLGDADADFLALPGGLERFAMLDDAALQPYRAAYWQRVAQAGVAAQGRCFVDMDPLKATRLPLIARLFPEARIMVMRRDPRDVVWSCFRTQFALTNAALDFTTLESTVRHYAAMMELIESAHERLSLNTHVIHYEALVRDFDSGTRAICAFAGLDWSEDMHQFAATARQRGVATASASQVRKGLYDGSGQWRPYARHLEPVLPILAPWIEKFGYEA